MANRVTVPVTNFEALSPPWSLTSLDQDLLALQGALNDSSLGYVITGTDTGTANHYNIATPAFGMPSSYQAGMTVVLVPANTNSSTSCTLAVGGLSVQPIQLSGSSTVPFGFLTAGRPILLTYIGTAFQILSAAAGPVGIYNNAPGATVNVSGYAATSLSVILVWSSVTTTAINLNNLVDGTHVSLTLVNNSAGLVTYTIFATDALTNSVTTYLTLPTTTTGAAPIALATSHTLSAGNVLTLIGASTSGLIYFNT